jgi:hypothetical protein
VQLFIHEKLLVFYFSPNIIIMMKSRTMRWEGTKACIGAKRNAYRFLVGEAEGKRPPAKLRRRWENNIKIFLREIGWGGVEWIHLAQERDQ